MLHSELQDEIRSELHLRAPIERVWEAVSTPQGFRSWFSEDVDGAFEVGEVIVLKFGKYGDCEARVVEKVERTSFAYQWHPGDVGTLKQFSEDQLTTVRFMLEPAEDGTKLTLIESGFGQIVGDRRLQALKDNQGGWTSELAELETFIHEGRAQEISHFQIDRTKMFKSPLDTVWNAVATADGLKKWFLADCEGELSPGSVCMWVFGPSMRGAIKVVNAEKPHKFSFRWHAGMPKNGIRNWDDFPEAESVLVEFLLTTVPEGTSLTITESGYENVPESRRYESMMRNKDGWSKVVVMLEEHLKTNG